ncbi:MAG: hypothetical protein DRQ51_06870 [Gammaproteobacteria bacterium]|nr:MAG: hypothetical protein DRQ51_06870 [Gammaproteobacteria bacterium]
MFKKLTSILSKNDRSLDDDCLSCSKEGSCSCIVAINAPENTQKRLMSMGVAKGTKIEILRNRAGDVVIKSPSGLFSIGSDVASQIEIGDKK